VEEKPSGGDRVVAAGFSVVAAGFTLHPTPYVGPVLARDLACLGLVFEAHILLYHSA